MIAIIAEKPSLARNIVAGLGTMTKKNGYFENENYIVTWAFGHLFSLSDIEDYDAPNATDDIAANNFNVAQIDDAALYDESLNDALSGESATESTAESKSGAATSDSATGGTKRRWRIDNLPCFPEKFKFKLRNDDGVKKQFEIIKTLINREDVTKIVNAGDSDREGEIIVRLCVYNALDGEKPFYRLWLPDQTPQTVKKAFAEMKNETEYDNLADEGFARTYIDWLYGVNLTRLVTLKTGTLLRVGRVIVPIVKTIYDREAEIENFKPQIYYALVSREKTNGEVVELVSSYKFPEEEKHKAEICCERMNKLEAIVTKKKTAKETLSAGKLYSLTKLQNYLGKKYKMTMERSLAAAQKLYENGYVSYPRTNSEYLATNEKDRIRQILSVVQKIGYDVCFKDKKNIFDDSKIESHSALTPTIKIPAKDALSADEKLVYTSIIRRFAAVFCKEECIAEKTELTVSLGGKEDYTLKGTVIIQPGWTKYDGGEKKDKILPNLNKGDRVNVDFHPEEKQTTPPRRYTIETLNNYLKNPFKDEKTVQDGSDDDDYKAIFKGLELGTEATRTGIIENAKKNGYISLKKDVYYIEREGRYLIERLNDMKIAMDKYKTSQLGQALKKVYRGEITVNDSVRIAVNEIDEIFKTDKAEATGYYGDTIGTCPICGKKVLKGKYGYGCSGYKDGCKFSIGASVLGAKINVEQARKLLDGEKTDEMSFVSKNGKPFNAKLKLDKNKLIFEFNDEKK